MYSFYMGGELLPITPAKLTTKIKGQNKTLNLINDGEVNFLKMPGLSEISFEAVFPMLGEYSFTNYQDGFKEPEYYLGMLNEMMASRQPFQFIVSRVSPSGRLLSDTNIKVSLEDYSISETAGDGLDVTVSVNLKQYIEFATKTITVEPAKGTVVAETTTRPSAPKAKTYTVKVGDCLWSIAQSQMGDGSKYPALYAANKEKIDAANKGTGLAKYTIYGGQVFTIP